MEGFSIAPADLVLAAHDLHELGEGLATSPVGRYGIKPSESGDRELAVAIFRAQEASQKAITLLSTTATSTASGLMDTAQTYADGECNSVEVFSTLLARWQNG